MSDDSMQVSYDVKDLLERMDAKIDKGFSKIFAELSDHNERITLLEQDKAAKTKARTLSRELFMMACSLVVALAAAAGMVTALHG